VRDAARRVNTASALTIGDVDDAHVDAAVVGDDANSYDAEETQINGDHHVDAVRAPRAVPVTSAHSEPSSGNPWLHATSHRTSRRVDAVVADSQRSVTV
jgi:hypothetical protein